MLRLPVSFARRSAPSLIRTPMFRQQRCLEVDSMDILQMKKGDHFVREGVLYEVQSRAMKTTGRGAAQGIMQAKVMKTGKHTELKGSKFDKVYLDKVRLYFDEVDEESETLSLRVFKTGGGVDADPVPTDTVFVYDEQGFENLIDGGEGSIKWLLPDMPLSGIIFDDALMSLKMPPQYTFTIKRVSQLGNENMALIDENDLQISIGNTKAKPGDQITVRLPKGRFIKKLVS
eukprot:TRINITY_DN35168_c0_g1_i1.p1 TRINITY_DN35168_c0_g1~~TRINITY_DN35168_c0_g1_i1.p1  ORF type:complete len:231 (+),score=36.98 TRINITY_DN35168_c0_g1_i1:47-739(+)